jgi:hypothetical protein
LAYDVGFDKLNFARKSGRACPLDWFHHQKCSSHFKNKESEIASSEPIISTTPGAKAEDTTVV